MSSRTARSDLRVRGGPALVLLVALVCLRPLEVRLAGPSAGLGRGVFGALGGMRAVVASGFWLRTNLAWERRDLAETRAGLALTVAADEAPRYYWVNGARMLAYDLAEWRLEPDAPARVRSKVAAEQAQEALAFLQDGLRVHPDDAVLLIEMANIHLRVLGDREGAARLFRQAAAQKEAPYYAARIHGELLVQLGRPAEAVAWLKRILPDLPPEDPAARRGVVEQRIKALEARLDAP
jgi:tetratricopeptide (TPR) repeat protein